MAPRSSFDGQPGRTGVLYTINLAQTHFLRISHWIRARIPEDLYLLSSVSSQLPSRLRFVILIQYQFAVSIAFMVSLACANCLLFKTCIPFRAICHSTALEGGSWLHACLVPTGSSSVRPEPEPKHSLCLFPRCNIQNSQLQPALVTRGRPTEVVSLPSLAGSSGARRESRQFAGVEARNSRTSFSCKAVQYNPQPALWLLYLPLNTGEAASCHHDAASLVKRQSHSSPSVLTPIA